MFLTRVSVAHPVFGAFSYVRLGLDQFPNVDVPIVVVITTYPGAPHETVETEVSKLIEEAINSVSGLDQITSTSYESRSVGVAEFRLEVAGPTALQEVRDKIAQLEARFAEDVDKPDVSRFNSSDQPILSITISGARFDVASLTALAERRIIRQLTTVSGVGPVTLVGGRTRQFEIIIDDTRMRALSISIDEVLAALRSGNQSLSAGNLVTNFTDLGIQIQGRIDVPADFLDMIVARRGGGPVYLRDIATVADGAANAESLAIYSGAPALAINIVKVQDAKGGR